MNKQQKTEHLNNGGALIRKAHINGEPIIKIRTSLLDWQRLKVKKRFPNNTVRDEFFNEMLEQPIFKED